VSETAQWEEKEERRRRKMGRKGAPSGQQNFAASLMLRVLTGTERVNESESEDEVPWL
jgi:hypothetical protein